MNGEHFFLCVYIAKLKSREEFIYGVKMGVIQVLGELEKSTLLLPPYLWLSD